MKLKRFNEHGKKTIIISAFPGCGKSHLFRNKGEKNILDSDSSTFDKSNFPQNYIQHIKSNIGSADLILVSSHKEVRDALVENGIDFTLVYPNRQIKDEYIKRYIDRGNNENFVNLLQKNWDNWMNELDEQIGCEKVELKTGQYLSDVANI
jgi:phosphosulfolactate synthase (CoM biosynthesis protein A)